MEPDNIETKIGNFADSIARRRKRNRLWEIGFTIAGISLSAGVTLVGVFRGGPKWAGVLGVLLSAVLAFDRAFGCGEKAATYRIMEAEVENLADASLLKPEERLQQLALLRVRLAQTRAGNGLKAIQPPN
jgi:hypothetical protein